ncbi:MAG: ATP-binding protein [Cellulophaga sp.]
MGAYNLTINATETIIPLKDIHFSKENKKALQQLLKEFKHIEALSVYNLPVDNKLLLFGSSGCGKTTTAKAIAAALDKKIITIDLSSIVSSKLGETSQNIASIFKKAAREKAILFIDEFDYIGRSRDHDNKDSEEMKRLVNTIIQLVDYFPTDAVLIAATNLTNTIDTALLRRFQVRLRFALPNRIQLDSYYEAMLSKYPEKYNQMERIYGVSYAEAKDILFKSVKQQIIAEEEEKALKPMASTSN